MSVENNKRIIIIDNYDSFTYNLVHIVEKIIGHEIVVKRNDEVTIEELNTYEYIILSPGPGLPDDAGMLKEIIREMGPKKKILGVCLGLQAIGEVYGSELRNLDKVFHGISTPMHRTGEACPIFDGIEEEFEAGRYHSWVIDKNTLVDNLVVTVEDAQGEIMAVHHKDYKVYGVQFHPESIMTPCGIKMLENFIAI